MTDKSHLPLPRRKRRRTGQTAPPPPPPRERGAVIPAQRKQLPALPPEDGANSPVAGRSQWCEISSRTFRNAGAVGLTTFGSRDDLFIGGGCRKGSDIAAGQDTRRASGLFISGRSASADCGELRIGAMMTSASGDDLHLQKSGSGYQLKSAGGVFSSEACCWLPADDQLGPVYHELDPFIVAREPPAYHVSSQQVVDNSESSNSSGASYHTYQSIADVCREVDQLRQTVGVVVSAATSESNQLSSLAATGPCQPAEHQTQTTSPPPQTTASSSTKWAIFSRLRLPRRGSPSKQTVDDVLSEHRPASSASTLARLSLSPGAAVRNDHAVGATTSPTGVRVVGDATTSDRKQPPLLSSQTRRLEKTCTVAPSVPVGRRIEAPSLVGRPLPLVGASLTSSPFSENKHSIQQAAGDFVHSSLSSAVSASAAQMRRTQSGDGLYVGFSPCQPGDTRISARRPQQQSGSRCIAAASAATSIPTSSPFSSPCCGVRMAEMRAATRRSSISVTSPGSTRDPSPTTVTSPKWFRQYSPDHDAGFEVDVGTVHSWIQRQNRSSATTGNEVAAAPCAASTAAAAAAAVSGCLDTISEEDSSSSRYYVPLLTSKMASSVPGYEHVMSAPASGVPIRRNAKATDDDRRQATVVSTVGPPQRPLSTEGSRRPPTSNLRVRHQSADSAKSQLSELSVPDGINTTSTVIAPSSVSSSSQGVRGARSRTKNTADRTTAADKNGRTASGQLCVGSVETAQPHGGSIIRQYQQHLQQADLNRSWDRNSTTTTATDTPPSSSSSSDRSATSTLDSEILVVPDKTDKPTKVDPDGVEQRNVGGKASTTASPTSSDRNSRGGGSNVVVVTRADCRVAVATTKKTSRLRSPKPSSVPPGNSREKIMDGSTASARGPVSVSVDRAGSRRDSPGRCRLPKKTSNTDVGRARESRHHQTPVVGDASTTVVGSCQASATEMSSSMTSSSGSSSAAGCVSSATSGCGGDGDSPDFAIDRADRLPVFIQQHSGQSASVMTSSSSSIEDRLIGIATGPSTSSGASGRHDVTGDFNDDGGDGRQSRGRHRAADADAERFQWRRPPPGGSSSRLVQPRSLQSAGSLQRAVDRQRKPTCQERTADRRKSSEMDGGGLAADVGSSTVKNLASSTVD